jgi:molybdopterin molybdotransferase
MRLGQAADDPTQLRAAIEGGLGHDILTITGGVSAGDYDLVPDSLRELGVEVLFHKVAQKPGMPLLFGKRGSTLVFGLPGNPVACFLCFELYVGPAVRRLAGEWDFETKWLDGVAGADSHVKSDRTHFKAAKVRFEGSRWRVHPMPSHGSADIFSVVGTNAFARFEKGKYTVSVGEQVRFFFYRAKQPLV